MPFLSSCCSSISNRICPTMISVRNHKENNWKLLNRSNGDIYNGDNNSTIRFKFFLHAIWCIPTGLTFRLGARALWVFTGMPLHNGYTMGKHRWKNIRMDQFYKNDRKALQNGKKEKLFHFFVITGSMIEQTAKDGAKLLTYPVVVLVMEFIAIGGIFCPITAKRAQASVDHFAHMNNRHGETFYIGDDTPCVLQWKEFLTIEIIGAGYATPCMHPDQHLEEINSGDFGECKNKGTKRHIANLLKTHHNYFTHNLCNNTLKNTCEDLTFYLSIDTTTKEFKEENFNNYKTILSHLQDIIKTQNERSVGVSNDEELEQAINELQEQVKQLRKHYSTIEIDNRINEANEILAAQRTKTLPIDGTSWQKSLEMRSFDHARNRLYTAFEAERVIRDNTPPVEDDSNLSTFD